MSRLSSGNHAKTKMLTFRRDFRGLNHSQNRYLISLSVKYILKKNHPGAKSDTQFTVSLSLVTQPEERGILGDFFFFLTVNNRRVCVCVCVCLSYLGFRSSGSLSLLASPCSNSDKNSHHPAHWTLARKHNIYLMSA